MRKYLLIMLTLMLGLFYTSQAQMSILLVNDNAENNRVDTLKQAITEAGYSFGFWDAVAAQAGPGYDYMAPFNLVIWYTGNDGASLYFWNGDETANQDIMDYIDNGGMFWVQGLDFLYDKYPEVPSTFLPGEFVYDYLGIELYQGQSHIDDGVWSDGVPELDLVEGNGIFSIDPLLWVYDAMWYVDALLPTSNAQSVYQMGPAGYDLSDYFSAVYYEKGDGKVLSCAFETARIKTPEITVQFFTEALDYFAQFATPGVQVEQITVSAEGGATTLNENYGTLQFSAEVLPEDATIPFVFWSVVSDGVMATIDQNGLLQASGTDNGNGIVWVKASAVDGSGVADSVQIEISNQGGGFTVLLVNDNANGVDRYKVIDTSLVNLEYIHNVYNTVVTGDFPDYETLSAYDLVIWYTGNDGVNLYLWDVSDTVPGAVDENLKFNAPLMQYLNNGGMVWLQGLDWIYDIYKVAFDIFNPGSFMYDKLGISAYVAQSHVDGDPLPQLDVVPGNPICTFTPVKWVYADGLWYADALDITDNAQGIYKMGPSSYIYSDYYSGVYMEQGNWRIYSLTVETARIDTRENTDAFFADALNYFEEQAQGVEEFQNKDFTLYQNSPNPVRDFTVITYDLQKKANVELSVYDITGRKVFSGNQGTQSTGTHSIEINTKNAGMSNGFYTYSLKVNDQIISRKMIITK